MVRVTAWSYRRAFTCLAAIAALAGCAHAQPYQTYYGLLHAHTRFSDGSGTPAEAYAMARAEGLHFFAVTPHNHAAAEDSAEERKDGLLIATDQRLYDSNDDLRVQTSSGEEVRAVSVRRAAREATTPAFVALYGQEFSTISSGNHVNVLGVPSVLENTNGDFRGLYTTLSGLSAGGVPPVVQLNHPNVQEDLFYAGSKTSAKKKMFNDYGFDEHGRDFRELVAASDGFVALIEILSGPAMAEGVRAPYRYLHPHENDYYYYLVQGLHISPSAGQDNHYKTWGRATPARMGVLAAALTQDALFAAMHENRTFATEDKNLSVILSINGQVMGSCLQLDSGADLAISVQVGDSDEPAASYEVTLVYGDIQPQDMNSLQRWAASDGESETLERQGDGAVAFAGYTASGDPEFYYVRVEQSDQDRAWSAPVWINHPRSQGPGDPRAQWAWTSSSGSEVYHHAWCKIAQTIQPARLRTGETPPPGRRLHNCVRPPADPEH